MSASAATGLLERARTRGYRIWLDGDRLRCLAPTNDESLIDDLRAERASLIELLRAETIAKRPRGDGSFLPLSSEEEGVWFVMQLEGPSATYNIPSVTRVRGPLDRERLAHAVQALALRHEAFRTRIVVEGGIARRVVLPHAEGIELEAHHPREVAAADPLASALGIAQRCSSVPFDLVRGPSFRAHLIPIGKDDHLVCLVLSHLFGDGTSVDVALRDLWALYEGRSLPELKIDYADYAAWQREYYTKERVEKDVARLADKLHDLPPLDLPSSRPRPPLQSFAGHVLPFVIDEKTTIAIRDLATSAGVSTHVVLLAGWQLLLHRYSGQAEFGVLAPVTLRGRPELEPIVGLLVNPIPMRARFMKDASVRDYLKMVQQEQLEAIDLAHVPFDAVVRSLPSARDPSRAPLCQTSISVHPHRPPLSTPGLELEPLLATVEISKYDCSLDIAEQKATMSGFLEYATALFDERFMSQLARHYVRILGQLANRSMNARVGDLEVLDDAERHTMLVERNTTSPAIELDAAKRTIHENFERQVDRTPKQLAVLHASRTLTYEELDHRANGLAHHLIAAGVRGEEPVGLLLRQSPEALIGILGILKAGATYVPVDVTAPKARRDTIFSKAGVRFVVTMSEWESELAAAATYEKIVALDRETESTSRRPLSSSSERSLAYVLYTSGTTGEPKGALVEHRGVVNYAFAMDHHAYRLGPSDRMLQFASIAFDVFAEEVFPCLFTGATIVIRTPDMLDPNVFLENCRSWDVTAMNLPTAFWAHVSESVTPEKGWPPRLRFIVIGGERAVPDQIARWKARGFGAKLINSYGATEATIVSTYCDPAAVLDDEMREVPIGRPIHGVQVYVLDSELQPCPTSVRGELYIAGSGVARGYAGDAAKSAERFVPDPFGPSGARMYRTGDVARWLPDGNLQYFGRSDHQVKVRGFRIELGEIESVLATHEAVDDVCVVAREDTARGGDTSLVAYVASASTTLSHDALRDHLASKLPSYMVPAAFVVLPKLPRNTNGKVDRKALPEPTFQSTDAATTTPMDPVAAKLAEIWKKLLKVEAVALADNFFKLGGHSLLAIQLAARARTAFAPHPFPVRLVFEHPTLGAQAEQLASANREKAPLIVEELVRQPFANVVPLSWPQKALWEWEKKHPGTACWNSMIALRLRGPLDRDRLAQALACLGARHDILRSRIVLHGNSGEPELHIGSESEAVKWTSIVDLSKFTDQDVHAWAHRSWAEPFGLTTGAPLFRVELGRRSDDDHVLLLLPHHIIADGPSENLIVEDLAKIYGYLQRGEPLPERPFQSADFTEWERRRTRGGPSYEAQLAYWEKTLEGALPTTLPSDEPKVAANDYSCHRAPVAPTTEMIAKLDTIARAEGATRPSACLAVLFIALYTELQQTDLSVIALNGNRGKTTAMASVVGHFVLHQLIRLRIDDNSATFRTILQQVHRAIGEAIANDDVPAPIAMRSPSPLDSPVGRIVFNTLPLSAAEPMLGDDVAVEWFFAGEILRRLDIVVVFADTPKGVSGFIGGSAARFERKRMTDFATLFLQTWERCVGAPNALLKELRQPT